jgi:hypothetical protein
MTMKIRINAGLILLLFISACTQAIASPTEQPTLEATAISPTTALPVGRTYDPINACDNPYYPHAPGSWWETSDGSIYSIAKSEGDALKATALVENTGADGKITLLHYSCEQGRLDLVSIGEQDEEGNEINLQSIAEITEGKCETMTMLPSEADLLKKQTWKQCETSCHVTASVPLVTDIGTYDALRVDCDNGSVRYYVYGLGLIRTCTIDGCLEVTDFTLPF